MVKIKEGAMILPKGFCATGAHIGLKKEKKDLALLVSKVPAVVAGCFTQNLVKAAPVLWDEQIVASGNRVRGIVINAGNANACTGEKGLKDTHTMAQICAEGLGCQPEEVLVCSTGVIGVPLPMDKVEKGIRRVVPDLADDENSAQDAAEAIMTTDTFMKTVQVQVEIGGVTVTIAGMAKGSGMIHPNMATMLGFVTTDANIDYPLLQKALSVTTAKTYNMISVDGDTSTNDTILALANGLAAHPLIDKENEDYQLFLNALLAVNRKLAVDIARDGEGATKLLEVNVTGAQSEEDAVKIAKSVISSSLLKAALFGEDANWGRVLCAMGYSGGQFHPFGVDIWFRSLAGRVQMMENGNPIAFDEDLAASVLGAKDIFIDIMLQEGEGMATAWGCDLTYDYVKINGSYRS